MKLMSKITYKVLLGVLLFSMAGLANAQMKLPYAKIFTPPAPGAVTVDGDDTDDWTDIPEYTASVASHK